MSCWPPCGRGTTCSWIGRTYNKRPATGQLATTGAYGLATTTLSNCWVIIGKPINSTYSGTGGPLATPKRSIATPQKDLPILAYITAGLFAIVRIRCAIRTYGLETSRVDSLSLNILA